jgi:NACHT domain
MEPTLLSAVTKGVLLNVSRVALQYATRRLDSGVATVNASDASVSHAITRHLQMISDWSASVTFRDLSKPAPLFDVYVDLDLHVTPKRLSLTGHEPRASSVDHILDLDANCVLLGDAGAGKTTSIKRIAKYALTAYDSDTEHTPLPLLVPLRTLRDRETLTDRLLSELGITFVPTKRTKKSAFGSETEETAATKDIGSQLLTDFLSRLRVKILLDGLDELPNAKADNILKELQQLLVRIGPSRAVVTCRSAAFVGSLHEAQVFELAPLDDEQIKLFVSRWLREPGRASSFLEQLNTATYRDTAVRPLVLALYCALFQRYGSIPERPRTAWKKLVRLLLDDWDSDNLVSRPSRYANFASDRKEEFLERLSFELQRTSFSHQDLELTYRLICGDYDLPKPDAAKVAREIESHSGLVVQNAFESYRFAHKSIQEFLAAQYIVKSGEIPMWPRAVTDRPNEYAVAVALSSRSGRYLASLVLGPLSKADDHVGIAEFIDRLVKEKPDFAEDPVLGVAILVMGSIVESPKPSESMPRIRHLLSALLLMPNIIESVNLAKHHFHVVERGDEVVVLRYHDSLSPEARVTVPPVIRVGTYLVSSW